MTGTARLVRSDLPCFFGDARLYELDPPMPIEGGGITERVIVAAIQYRDGECLTDIFPADESGAVTEWNPQDGSFHDGFDHGRALKNAGYEVLS